MRLHARSANGEQQQLTTDLQHNVKEIQNEKKKIPDNIFKCFDSLTDSPKHKHIQLAVIKNRQKQTIVTSVELQTASKNLEW